MNFLIFLNATALCFGCKALTSNFMYSYWLFLYGGLYLPLSVIGVTSNVLIAVILGRDTTMHRTIRFLLQMLSFSDMVLYMEHITLGVRLIMYPTHWVPLISLIVLFSKIGQMTSAWLAATVTFQRYIAISRPLSARHLNTMPRTRAAVAVVLICSFVIHIPHLLDIMQYYGLMADTFSNRINFLLYGLNALFITKIIKLIIAYWLPLLLTVYFNVSLIVATRRSDAFRRQQLQSEADDNRMSNNSRRVTITMIAIVIVNLVCQLPITVTVSWNLYQYGVEYACEFYADTGSDCPITFCSNRFQDIGICLMIINSLSDCFTYFLIGKRFRQLLLRTLFCRHRKRQQATCMLSSYRP